MESPFWPSFTKLWHAVPYAAIAPTRPELSAAGKTVVVTGGASGIGLSTTRAFVAAGATKIAILGRREDKLLAAKAEVEADFSGVQVLALPTDITDEAQVDASFAKIEDVFRSKIDILISNSGYLPTPAKALESKTDLGDWWQAFQTNVLGAMYVARAFLKHASPIPAKGGQEAVGGRTGGPCVINVSSGIATIPALEFGYSAYAASKMAMARVFDYVALENPGLRVFNLHPGVITTDINIKSGHQGVDHVDLPAHFSVWLASPEADFLQGKFLWANWDVDELKAQKDKIANTPLLTTKLDGVSFDDFTGEWKA